MIKSLSIEPYCQKNGDLVWTIKGNQVIEDIIQEINENGEEDIDVWIEFDTYETCKVIISPKFKEDFHSAKADQSDEKLIELIGTEIETTDVFERNLTSLKFVGTAKGRLLPRLGSIDSLQSKISSEGISHTITDAKSKRRKINQVSTNTGMYSVAKGQLQDDSKEVVRSEQVPHNRAKVVNEISFPTLILRLDCVPISQGFSDICRLFQGLKIKSIKATFNKPNEARYTAYIYFETTAGLQLALLRADSSQKMEMVGHLEAVCAESVAIPLDQYNPSDIYRTMIDLGIANSVVFRSNLSIFSVYLSKCVFNYSEEDKNKGEVWLCDQFKIQNGFRDIAKLVQSVRQTNSTELHLDCELLSGGFCFNQLLKEVDSRIQELENCELKIILREKESGRYYLRLISKQMSFYITLRYFCWKISSKMNSKLHILNLEQKL